MTAQNALPPTVPPESRVPPVLWPPLLMVAEARQPVQLQKLSVIAEIVGSLARTRIELIVHNPNERALEGELQFPLLEGQTVTAFALDINGHLRPASPVDKTRGQQVFEDIVRRGADPALLEKTVGNNFKLRVYPLPARGERRVALVITENLRPGKDGRLAYRLPLDFGQKVGEVNLDLQVTGLAPGRLAVSPALEGATRLGSGKDTQVHWQQRNWKPAANSRPAQLSWPAVTAETLITDRFEDSTCFYAEVPMAEASAPRSAPRSLALIWDASGSGAGRDHEREFALLDAWFRKLGNLEVRLVVARERAEVAESFLVQRGNWRGLRARLESLAYDGASNPAAWSVPAGADFGLLFSDGLANWGETSTAIPGVPLYAVNAAVSADPARLRALAEASGGRYLDLLRFSAAEAATELGLRRARLVGLQGGAGLVSASAYPEGGRLLLAGQLSQPEAKITLLLESPKGEQTERHLLVKAGPSRPGVAGAAIFPGLAAQRWAGLTLARLETERNLHRAEIRRLGQRFSLVTAETSLIVLESLEDYLRYEVLPPPGDLRVEYEQQVARRQSAQRKSRSEQLDSLARRFADKVKWWDTNFPKDAPKKPAEPEQPHVTAISNARPRPMAPMPLAAKSSGAAPMMAAPPPMAAMARSEQASAALERRSAERAAPGAPRGPVASPSATIQLQKWQPDEPYARRLRDATDAERYAIYLDERASHQDSTAFFLDAAGIFFEHGQTDLGVRIVSNLAEMNLENRHILRLLAYRLSQAGQVKLALPLLKKVRELAPDEPQSSRDLGLAYAADGQYQAAIDSLWETVGLPWQQRFADIDLIALGELNAIAARNAGLDLSRIDPRLQRNLPLDLRAVLAWDADATDIDLWVTDPNGEKAYYAHALTYQGGRMSRDFTAGYGPEEFALKAAKPGRYEVRAHFFGHRQQIVSPYTSLMLRLSTGFGTPAQKDQDVILRLTYKNSEVLVGTFEVGTDAGKKP